MVQELRRRERDSRYDERDELVVVLDGERQGYQCFLVSRGTIRVARKRFRAIRVRVATVKGVLPPASVVAIRIVTKRWLQVLLL